MYLYDHNLWKKGVSGHPEGADAFSSERPR